MKLLLLGLISALFATAVSGAAGDLGEACTSSDTCNAAEAVCDQTGFCKLKEGQDCSGANAANCVGGAECVTANGASTVTCTCEGNVYTTESGNTGKCSVNEDKYLGTCPQSGVCSASSNLECVNSLCLCTQSPAGGFVPDLSTGTCKVAAKKVGRTCSGAETAATDDTKCGAEADTYLTCTGNGNTECACKAGFEGSKGETCKVAAKRVGRTCSGANPAATDDTKCGAEADTYLTCTGNKNTECACKAGFEGSKGETCTAIVPDAVDLGQACVTGDTCNDATGGQEAVCDQTGFCKLKEGEDCSGANARNCVGGAECVTANGASTCQCKDNEYTTDATNTGKCSVAADKYLGTCPQSGGQDGACSASSNLECVKSLCLCTQSPAGGFVPDLSTGTCTASAKKVGATCDPANNPEAETACGNRTTTNLECPLSLPPTTCSCVSGYTGTEGGDCTKITANTVDKICSSTSDCGSSTNLVCSAKRCVCKTGYSGSKGGDCSKITATVVGKSCSKAADCGSGNNLVCSTTTSTCTCDAGYYGATGESCAPIAASRVGKVCTTATAEANCGVSTSTFLECVSDKCACKTGYTGSDGGTCLKIPAKRIGASCESNTAATDCGSSSTTYLTCSSGACACKTYYSGDEGGYCDKTGTESGAGNLEMSVTLLALVGLLQLFMLR